MSTVSARDPYLDLPLHGLRLIQASAGTGKTFTLATLVTRLVVEGGLKVGQILAVTFTEAATQELRHRIRERLERTLQLLDGDALDEDVVTAAASDGAEERLSREILVAHIARGEETPAALQRRLQRAVHEIDLAAIFTIHGFCARALAEHALESGQGFDTVELLGGDKALRADLAADLWRHFGSDADDAVLLTGLWSNPDALAEDLRALLGDAPLQPQRPASTPDPLPAREVAFNALRGVFVADAGAFRDAMHHALVTGVLNKTGYQKNLLDEVWAALADYCAQDTATRAVDPRIERLGPEYITGKLRKGRESEAPQSPVCDAVDQWLVARDARDAWLADRRVDLLHRIRDAVQQRLRVLKQQRRVRTYDDLINDLALALDGAHGAALAAKLRAQYAIALVDEFQDTDARQWQIFDRVFGNGSDAPALFVIGDPKQAIYGFRGGDVQTYLAASRIAETAPALDRNFRSRPGVLAAVATLYKNASDGGDTPFVVDGIDFQPVHAGGARADGDYLRNGQPGPALTLRRFSTGLDDKDKPATLSADDSRVLAAGACVAAIHGVLTDARRGNATLKDRNGIHQPVKPGDIAVLVRSHKEANRIQRALAMVGIPAVAAGKQSLFASDEARELRTVFEALLQPADDSRLRAALATVLVGLDAADIASLDDDPLALAHWQHEAVVWRERWQGSGPLALVSDLCAQHASRLLGLLDGERRLTNLLQLGELLQEADARALGLHGLVDWFRGRIADADSDDESQLLRLESDARRVQIVTVHKSKGLEYPLVYLPFVGIGGKRPATGRHCSVHAADGGERVLQWKVDKDAGQWKAAYARHQLEEEAEDARLLYVGLTRARDALWLTSVPFRDAGKTRVWPMLEKLEASSSDSAIHIDQTPVSTPLEPLPPQSDCELPAARQARRLLPRDWWVYSFSQLARADGGESRTAAAMAMTVVDEGGASDEPLSVPVGYDMAQTAADETTAAPTIDALLEDRRFGGTGFGNVLHEALEHVDFAAWRDWQDGLPPPGQEAPLRHALMTGGYEEALIEDGVTVLTRLVGRTLTAPLPEGTCLADVPGMQRRAEMEFHFALQPTPVEDLLALLHAHGVATERQGFGLRRRLEGLMTGKIDLTYTHDGRWYLLDYKSNRLPAYDPAALGTAMRHSEYDLQSLIYTVALHRWLRFRLGDGYDYARDFGGARYLFCRGLEAADAGSSQPLPGIHAHAAPAGLVHALDALFAGRSA